MRDKNVILESAARRLEMIARSIRDKDFEAFDKLTYDINGTYCSFSQICVDVELCEVYAILERINRDE